MEASSLTRGLLRMPLATFSFAYPGSFCFNPRLLKLFVSNRSFNLSSRACISTEHLPRVAQPSLWQSIIPKSLRRSDVSSSADSPPKPKEWNPATIYILLGLLVGSQAIQLITLRNEVASFTRKADAKIALLKEVIERVQRGERVDVEGLLGTGDKDKEREWEEGETPFFEFLLYVSFACRRADLKIAAVLKELEQEDALWQTKKRAKQMGAEDTSGIADDSVARSKKPSSITGLEESANTTSMTKGPPRARTGPGFY